MQWSGDTDLTVRRVNTQMDMLDVFPHDVDVKAAQVDAIA
jgi:hypothetical protein